MNGPPADDPNFYLAACMLTFIFFLCSDTITIRKLFVPGTKTAFAVFFLILSIAQVATSSLLIHGARKVAAEEDELLVNFDRIVRENPV